MPRGRALCALFAGSGLIVASCSATRPLPPSPDVEETAYRTHISVLASDDFEGRRPGTRGEEKTIAYLVEQFRKLGLKPGNGESFLQPVPLVETLASPAASLSIAGSKGTTTLAYGKDVVLWTRRAVPVVELSRSELIFVGYGIVAPEYQWNDYAGLDVHGKTVVVLIGDPGHASPDAKVFKGNAMTSYGRWSFKVAEAARQGAAGVLLIHDAAAAGYGWNAVQSTWSGPQLDRKDVVGPRAAVEGWVQSAAARALFAHAGLDFSASAAAAARPGFKAMPLGLTADAILHSTVREIVSNNVLAIWPGSGRRQEYVVYAAHWDSLGSDPSGSGDRIFNGAVNGASGVAGLLAIAQSFSRTQPAPERSAAFLVVTGGAYGLLGSAYYADHPILPLRETAAVLDLDALHTGGPTRDVVVVGYGNTDLEDYARSAALLQGRELGPEPDPQQGLYFRTDSFSFANAGIPVLYATGGLDDSARGPAWGRAQLEDYMAHRFRQPGDQYSPDWDVRGALDDVKLYYDVGLRVARSRRFPRWYPNSEYRVTRNHD